jgi:hypothetical protein
VPGLGREFRGRIATARVDAITLPRSAELHSARRQRARPVASSATRRSEEAVPRFGREFVASSAARTSGRRIDTQGARRCNHPSPERGFALRAAATSEARSVECNSTLRGTVPRFGREFVASGSRATFRQGIPRGPCRVWAGVGHWRAECRSRQGALFRIRSKMRGRSGSPSM